MAESKKSPIEKRRYLRFAPDPTAYAQIDKKCEGVFEFQYVGLIVEESPMGGCGLVMLHSVNLEVEDLCRVKLGEMDPLKARVVWKKQLEKEIYKFGIKFLE